MPLFFGASDGNESDAAVFGEPIRSYQARLDLEALFVADAALYNEKDLKRMGDGFEARLAGAPNGQAGRGLVGEPRTRRGGAAEVRWGDEKRDGYRVAEIEAEYAGFEQRWIAVESGKRAERDLERLEKRLGQERAETQKKALGALRARPFEREPDASAAVKKLAKGPGYRRPGNVAPEAEPHHEWPADPARTQRLAGIATGWWRPIWCAMERSWREGRPRRAASSWPPTCSTPERFPPRRFWRPTWANRRWRSANRNTPVKTGWPIIGLEGLLGLVEMIEKLGRAGACKGEEGQKCPKERFPPVCKRPLTASWSVDPKSAQRRRREGRVSTILGAPELRIPGSEKIPSSHLERLAVVHVRQSTAQRALNHAESLRAALAG